MIIEVTTELLVCFTDVGSGSVRVLLASGEGGDDVVKGRSGNENGIEVAAVGMHLSSVSYFSWDFVVHWSSSFFSTHTVE